MKSGVVITVNGGEEQGGVDALLTAIRNLGAEVHSSKLMRLEGRMSVLMKAWVPAGQETRFRERLSEMFPALSFHYSRVPGENGTVAAAKRINLVVDGRNRPGVEETLEEILGRLDLRVERMECSRCRVAGLGETVFSARCALIVPAGLNEDAVADEIEALAEGVRVHVA